MAAPSHSPNTEPDEFKPYVPASESPAEFTPKAIILGSVFGIIFGAATVYLALKAGLTVSASIPIAVLSIAVFKKLGKSTILENNIVQTIGSAGESIAAGVVFTRAGAALPVGRRALLPATCRSSRSPPSAACSASSS